MAVLKTLKEAEERRDKLIAKRGNKFCPMVSGVCREDCLFYEPGAVFPKPSLVGAGVFIAYGPTCSHPFTDGLISVSVEGQ